jgi:mono/diheme cytochrome c family protein
LVVVARATAADGPARAADDKVDFVRDIQPIFESSCYKCHDGAKHKGGLRLDNKATAFIGGDSGEPSLVAHDADHSKIIPLVRGDDPNSVMPPKGDRLSKTQIDLLTRWINQGAAWPDGVDKPAAALSHWSFSKPVRPALPAVKLNNWCKNPIDQFILAKLEKEGLAPSPEADKYTLCRRLYLDLIGLPPSPAEVDAFVNDHSADAYETLVDQLQANPHYGERWARPWLDCARYADSAGYGSDPLRRTSFRFRDWLIQAYNRNLPYDEFTIEQLAGDLLPNPTTDQLIATNFNRNTMTNTEGGTDREEFRTAAVKDRVETTVQTWMGLTMGCAQCQTEDDDQPNESPTIPTPTVEEQAKMSRLKAEIETAEKKLDDASQWADAQAQWEKKLKATVIPRIILDDDTAITSHPVVEMPESIAEILATPVENRTPAQKVAVFEYFKSNAPQIQAQRDQIARLKKKLADIRPAMTAIMRQMPVNKQRKCTILIKGNFLNKGPVVQPAVLAAFNPLPRDAKPDRMGLAKWFLDQDNPLTARVAVNRFWATIFGVGIVETQEDFGTQGQLPSNQALLDWLAVEFRDPQTGPEPRQAWDMKRLVKLIVTSAAYRQTSRVTPELLEKDPRNRLISRGPRRRLEAEMVRDQALSLSGLISLKMFGPSVFPPQPDGLWQAAFNGERTWPASKGEDKYRRGIYVFWRRTVPYPSMAAFDAPSREVCTLRRIPTSTPLQAFVTLNDPVYVECAQALARRIAKEGGSQPEDRAAYALRLCLGRPPKPQQVTRVLELYNEQLKRYSADTTEAKKMATEGAGPLPDGMKEDDLAAWTVCANVLLNLDGVLTNH